LLSVYFVSVSAEDDGVQLLNDEVDTVVPDKADADSKVVEVFTAPAVIAIVPEHVPVIVKVLDHPLEVNEVYADCKLKVFVEATGPDEPPPPPPPPQAVNAAEMVNKINVFLFKYKEILHWLEIS